MAEKDGTLDNELSRKALENLKDANRAIAESNVYPMKLEPNTKYKFLFNAEKMEHYHDTYKGKQADYESAFYTVIEDGDVTETPVKIKLPLNKNVSGAVNKLLTKGPRWIGVEKTLTNNQTRYVITPAN